jgi:hypothetical protein
MHAKTTFEALRYYEHAQRAALEMLGTMHDHAH